MIAGWLVAIITGATMPAWAQETCANGAACVDAFRGGAWGLVVIGLLFFAVGVLPATAPSKDEAGNTSLPLIGLLQARIAKETTGWRRWQWPVLGVFCVGLGLAHLAGGR